MGKYEQEIDRLGRDIIPLIDFYDIESEEELDEFIDDYIGRVPDDFHDGVKEVAMKTFREMRELREEQFPAIPGAVGFPVSEVPKRIEEPTFTEKIKNFFRNLFKRG